MNRTVLTPALGAPVPTLRDALRMAIRLLRMIRPYWGRIVKGVGLSVVIGLFGLVSPLLSKLFFDDVYPSRDVAFMHVLVIGVAVVTLTSTLMNGIRNYYGQVIGARLNTEMSLLFFNHIQHLETRFFDDRRIGEILSRSGDLQRSVNFLTGVVQTVIVNGIYLLLVPPLLLILNWQLALLSLITVPLTSAVSLVTGRATRSLSRRSMEINAEVGGYQYEVLSNIRVIKALAAEPTTFGGMDERLTQAQSAQLQSNALRVVVEIVNATIRTAGTAIFTWFAWSLILEERLTLGGYIAFSAYLGYLTGPVGQFASLFNGFQQTAVSLGRFFEYYDAPVEQDPAHSMAPRSSSTKRLRGALELRNVTFGYAADRPVLCNASLTAGPGGVTAIVGRSGAGKSSIVKLLLRMYAPQSGTVLIDGIPISQLPLATLRSEIGVVWQDTGLLRGTLRENLLLGTEHASVAVIDEALRIACLETFVASLPQGLDTTVAEWGGTLSGGQRQRLAIARALVRPSSLLILDEATSNLDSQTEEDLLRAVFPRARNTTILFITHRLVSASLADRIFLVTDGTVVGGGPHDQLLRESDVYRSLWLAATGQDGALPHAVESASGERGRHGTTFKTVRREA